MTIDRIRELLLQPSLQRDPGFRKLCRDLSSAGLRSVGVISIVLSSFMMLALATVEYQPVPVSVTILFVGVVLSGLLCVLAGYLPQVAQHGATVGMMFGVVVAGLLMWMSFLKTSVTPGSDRFIPAQVAIVLMVALASLPLRPLQTLLFGSGIALTYVISASVAAFGLGLDVASNAGVILVFLIMQVLLATALSTIIFSRTCEMYQAHRAEMRAFVSQSGATMGRLAAALSHELNTPVGTLKSSIDTLEKIAARRMAAATVGAGGADPLDALESDLRASARKSAVRLQEIVARMHRLTNLDRAEIQRVDLNGLVKDVVYLLESQTRLRDTDVKLMLDTLPEVACRPEQISAVLVSLVENAVDASAGRGPVTITTIARETTVEIRIHDSGPGIRSGTTTVLFDPGFREANGRVGTSNWSMFTSRQIVREHGGDIRLESATGRGTTVTVTLPVA